MPRYEVVVDTDTLSSSGAEVVLSGPEGRHLARVRRIRRGATARLKDGLGLAFSATVMSVRGERVVFELVEQVPCPDDTLPLVLMPAVIKGKRMDWLIQKACELGVRDIRPVVTERTVIRLGHESRSRRWQEIAVQALKQCSGNRLTRIYSPLSLADLLDNIGVLFKIMLWEGDAAKSLLSLMQDNVQFEKTGILAGPEGGFTPREAAMCIDSGFSRATLGPRILRTETAAFTAAAQLSAIFHAE